MTPTARYIPPAPLVTHIYPLSNRYHQAARVLGTTHAARLLNGAPRLAGVALRSIVPFILNRPLKRMVAALLHAGRLLDRLANAILTFTYESVIALIRALAAPMLALGLFFLLLFILKPDNRQSLTDAAPTLTALAPEADAKPLPAPALKKAPVPKPPPTRLARYHGSAQRLTSEQAQVDALADALNIPPEVVKANVTRALDLAHTNARAMRRRTGRFPLPKHTADRLLAALTPADVDKLAILLGHAASIDKRAFTLRAELSSGDLVLVTRVTALDRTSTAGACFRYAMTFMRRTFRHALTVAACRRRAAWTYLTPTAKGN